jgi:hypothetical protein
MKNEIDGKKVLSYVPTPAHRTLTTCWIGEDDGRDETVRSYKAWAWGTGRVVDPSKLDEAAELARRVHLHALVVAGAWILEGEEDQRLDYRPGLRETDCECSNPALLKTASLVPNIPADIMGYVHGGVVRNWAAMCRLVEIIAQHEGGTPIWPPHVKKLLN